MVIPNQWERELACNSLLVAKAYKEMPLCDWRQLKEISSDDDIKPAKSKVFMDKKDLPASLI
jgi:hypothetical protein